MAERGVALMQNFNKTLMKDEEQQQFILQVVERNQKLFPNSLKTTVILDSRERYISDVINDEH